MQFQLELLLRQGFEGVYYIMPSFRGEEPDTTHLNQFFHSEAEIRGGLEEVMQLVEHYVRRIAAAALEECGDDLARAAGSTRHVEDLTTRASFPRIRFRDALKLLGDDESFFANGPGESRRLTRRGEQELIRRHGGVVWVTHFDRMTVPFYQAVDSEDVALTGDLLLGRGEAVGCGERRRTRAQVEGSLKDHRVDPGEYEWYLRMKEHSPIRTAGFGMGLERFLLWLLRHDDARDLQVFPRVKGTPSWI
jgi:aspartyl/asparaginyl-tRNA synthetase